MTLKPVTLDDKYTLTTGRIFITGTQALVRLPMTQQQRDHRRFCRSKARLVVWRESADQQTEAMDD